jgi:hypothetical protein
MGTGGNLAIGGAFTFGGMAPGILGPASGVVAAGWWLGNAGQYAIAAASCSQMACSGGK